MRFLRRWGGPSRIAGVVAAVALAWAAWSAGDALRAGPPAPGDRGGPPALPRAGDLPSAEREATPGSVVLAAVARDPFRADRTKPPRRYRLPSERRSGPPARDPGARLLGTALGPDGVGLAVVEMFGRSGRVLRVGQAWEEFRLVRVEPGRAVLAGPDTTLVLTVREALVAGGRR